MNVIYRVRRPFRYGNTHYKTGDEFAPTGGPYDETLIARFCWTDRRPEPKKKIKKEEAIHADEHQLAE